MITNRKVQRTNTQVSFGQKGGHKSNRVQVNEAICGNQLQKRRVNSSWVNCFVDKEF